MYFVDRERDNSNRNNEAAVLSEQQFLRVLSLEQKRSARSGKPLLLIRLASNSLLATDGDGSVRATLLSGLVKCTRETDVRGWYRADSVLAVLITEFAQIGALHKKIDALLASVIPPDLTTQIRMSVQLLAPTASVNFAESRKVASVKTAQDVTSPRECEFRARQSRSAAC